MSENNLFEEMKAAIQAQIKEAYMDGVHQGAITTCAIIYGTMRAAGLEETNFLFDMLRDISKQHGEENLAAIADRLQERTQN